MVWFLIGAEISAAGFTSYVCQGSPQPANINLTGYQDSAEHKAPGSVDSGASTNRSLTGAQVYLVPQTAGG